MKRILAFVLVLALVLTGCSSTGKSTSSSAAPESGQGNEIIEETEKSSVEAESDKTEESVAESDSATPSADTALATEEVNFTSLNDPKLLQYVEDSVYSDLVAEFASEDYIIEKVSLSNMDNDAFFYDDFKFEYLIDENLIKSSKKLTEKEKTVLEDLINEIPLYVTAKKLNTSLNSISVLRNKARNKLKKDLGGNKYGR